jgi:glc operon protein GlcG
MITFKRLGIAGLLAASAVVALGMGSASAQLAKFTISPDAAKKLMARDELSLDTAQKIGAVCLDFAKAHNLAVSIFIYDQTGEPIYMSRMDGQGKTNIETARLKAQTVLNTHRSSHVDMNRVLNGQASEFHEGFYNGVFANKGGLPIIVDGIFLGAIGVGGSNMDEECGQAGLEKIIGAPVKLEPNLNIPRGGPRAGQ